MGEIESHANGGKAVKPLKYNVVMCGLAGCGKSTVGWHLAQLMGFAAIDLDEFVENKERMPIEQIFKERGEPYFRKVEKEATLFFLKARYHVLSLGGGALMDDEIWQQASTQSITVWLKSPLTEIVRRLVNRPAALAARPLLADLVLIESKEKRSEMLRQRLEQMMAQREKRFSSCDVVVENSYGTAETTARIVKQMLIAENFITDGTHRALCQWDPSGVL